VKYLPQDNPARRFGGGDTLHDFPYNSKIPKIPKTPIEFSTKFAKMEEDE